MGKVKVLVGHNIRGAMRLIHLFKVDRPMPKSDATCSRVSPIASVIRTPSTWNSPFRFVPLVRLLCRDKCCQRSGIKPWQVQSRQKTIGGYDAQIVKFRYAA